MLFEHSIAMTLSRQGGIVNDVSGMINVLQISLRSSLSRELNASSRKSFSTFVRQSFLPFGQSTLVSNELVSHSSLSSIWSSQGSLVTTLSSTPVTGKLVALCAVPGNCCFPGSLFWKVSMLQILHVSTDCRQLTFHPQ